MAYIFRLIFLFMFCFSVGHAEISPSPLWKGDRSGVQGVSSPELACMTTCINNVNNPNDTFHSITDGPGPQKTCFYERGTDILAACIVVPTYSQCPANSTLQSGSCVCSEGYEERGGECRKINPCPEGLHEEFGVCVPDDCKPDEVRQNGLCVKEPPCPEGETRVNGVCKPAKCKRGEYGPDFDVDTKSLNWASCEAGCVIVPYAVIEAIKGGKVVERIAMTQFTGATCTGGETPPTDEPGTPGQDGDGGDGGEPGGDPGDGGDGPGTGGGTGGGSGGGDGDGGQTGNGGGTGPRDPSAPDPTPKPNDGTDGSKPNGIDPGGPESPEGEGNCKADYYKGVDGKCWQKEPEEKEPDIDGKCPPGTAKADDKCVPYQPVEDEGKDDKPSNFGGACVAGFACEGDAIQCAIAKEMHVRNCALFNTESFESRLYDEEKGKTGNQTINLPGNESVDINGRIDTSDALGGGACVADLNISVMGQSITLPFSQLCPYLAMLGNLLVAVSLLLAARIIMRG